MKSLFASLLSFTMLVMMYAFSLPSPEDQSAVMFLPVSGSGFDVPEDVQQILDKSCLPCHGPDGKFKAKLKFNWENLSEMDKSGQISKLSKIIDEVNEDKMPPSKFRKKNPDKVPTADEKSLLVKWAEHTAQELLGEK